MNQSEKQAKKILERLLFQQIKKCKGDSGTPDFEASLDNDSCAIEIKSVRKGEISKFNSHPTATLKKHQIYRMAELQQQNIRPFVLYLDLRGRYFLFEMKKANIQTS